MSKRIGRTTAALAGVFLTGVGFLLRRAQLTLGYGDDLLPLPGAWIALAVFSVICAAAAALYCRKLGEQPSDFGAFDFGIVTAVASAAGAGLILASCLLMYLESDRSILETVSLALGIIAALCLVAAQGAQYRKKAPSPALGMLPILFYIVRLIQDFKRWSMDPIILDYWVKLFAMLAALLAAYYVGGFGFGKGKRRLTALFCLLAVFFCGMCLADGGVESALLMGGTMLWTGACGWQLLRPDEGGEPATEKAE